MRLALAIAGGILFYLIAWTIARRFSVLGLAGAVLVIVALL